MSISLAAVSIIEILFSIDCLFNSSFDTSLFKAATERLIRVRGCLISWFVVTTDAAKVLIFSISNISFAVSLNLKAEFILAISSTLLKGFLWYKNVCHFSGTPCTFQLTGLR